VSTEGLVPEFDVGKLFGWRWFEGDQRSLVAVIGLSFFCGRRLLKTSGLPSLQSLTSLTTTTIGTEWWLSFSGLRPLPVMTSL
jgi:hypothetical protein